MVESTSTDPDNEENLAKRPRCVYDETLNIGDENPDDVAVFQEVMEYEETTIGEDGEVIYLPPHMRCFSHSLSLLCTTDIKKNKFLDQPKFMKIYE